MDFGTTTAVQLSKMIKSGEITVMEAVQASLNEIEKNDKKIHSFITVDKEQVFKKAENVQKKINNGELTGPLAGVPIAVKDNICTKNVRTTCASNMLRNFVPAYDAYVIEKLNEAGMLMVGKTNMDEFAMGNTTETSTFGETRNPVNIEYVPGGSSGGSCAAVASGEVRLALGSDTGGSIRQPSAFCGVTGMKPTYGAVSRYGLIAYASSLDQIGPIAKDVRDCAALLSVIVSHDQRDSTSVFLKGSDFTSALRDDIRGLKIGVPVDYYGEGLDAEIKACIMKAAHVLKDKGAILENFELGMTEYAIPAYYIIASAEASSNLERFDGVKYGYRSPQYDDLQDMYKKSRSQGFGSEVKRRIMLGSFTLSSGYYDAYYMKALKAKTLIKKSFDDAFQKYDMLLTPVTPGKPLKCGDYLHDPLKRYLGDVYTVSANLAGLPAMSVPCGKDSRGFPVGMQLIGECFSEKKLLRAAYSYERR